MASPSSLISGTRTSHSHQLAIKHLFIVSGLCLLPTSTLSCPHCLPAKQHLPPEFYLRWGCVSKPHTSETAGLGQALTHWGRVSVSSGQGKACPENMCVIVQQQRFRGYGKSQNTAGSRFHSGVFVPIPANVAALWGPHKISEGRPYGLYQVHSKQGNRFSTCGPWTSQAPLPARGESPYFLTRAQPGTELQNFRLCTPLFIESW